MKIYPILVLLILGFHCTFSERKEDQPSTPQTPNTGFFDQLAGPDGMDIDIFRKGMKMAKIQASKEKIFRDTDGEWTVQGPANIGGRINVITVDPTDESIIYAGFGLGGIFKTTNGGSSWEPIFDQNEFTAISSIVIDPSDHNTLFVGTGDVAIGGYPNIGNGVFKSTDAGSSWTSIGLEDMGIISKIIVSPTNPNIIYASSMGFPMKKDNNRGLYKTTNGGATWTQSLFISDTAGIIDLVMDPNDPNTLFAAGWNRYRSNTESIIKGPASKIYKTKDGGITWDIIQDNLPQYDLSRVGLAIYPSNPAKVYAIYIGNDFAIHSMYRSDDAGEHWNALNVDGLVEATSSFGWYFGNVWVNPNDSDDIFVSGVELWRSQDGGQSWNQATPPWYEYTVHADMHSMAFLPSGKILLGTDGGMYGSTDNGATWLNQENIPTNMVYRTAYDATHPNHYWGGLQDNGTTTGNKDNISNWDRVWGGDGFGIQINPLQDYTIFVSSQRGNIVKLSGGSYTYLSDYFGDDRTNWDTPYFLSLHDTLNSYYGTFKVYKGVDSGFDLDVNPISEDLTDGPIEPQRYHTITALSESPIRENLLLAGTSDGNVWYNKDAPFSEWTQIDHFDNDFLVSDVVASPTDTNTIYVSESAYLADDFTAKIWKTTDLGDTWISIAGDLPPVAINEILILPGTDDNTIFVANDAGVYVTQNGGEHWERVGTNMPFIPVYDLVHNVANEEIVAATFGRSIQTYPLSNLPSATESTDDYSQRFDNNVRLAPNPAQDIVEISFRKIEPTKTAELVILDMSGRIILQQKMNSNKTVINITNWKPGNYPILIKERHRISKGQLVVVGQ